jgi:hypothetical protein
MNQIQHQQSETQPQQLTTWKNEPTILTLKQDLQSSKSAHDIQVGKINTWNDLSAVRGKAKPKKVKGRSSVQPKLIRRQAEWRYSALTEPFLNSDRIFSVKPTTFEDADGAKQNQLVLNWQFRTKLNRIKFIDDYVRANVDEGTVIVRLGWKRVTVPIKQTVPEYTHYAIEDEQQLDQLKQAIELKQSDPRTFDEGSTPEIKAAVDLYEKTQQPTYAVQTGQKVVTVDKVLENRPTLEVKNPANVFVDPSCGGDLDKALYVIESFETNKADLLKEGSKYKNLEKVNWEANSPLSTPDHVTSTPQEAQITDQLRRKTVAYEYWGFYDINGDGLLKSQSFAPGSVTRSSGWKRIHTRTRKSLTSSFHTTR